MGVLTNANKKFAARQFGGPRLARFIDSGGFGSLELASIAASGPAVDGKIMVVDATAANVIITAPDPATATKFGLKLYRTASSHTMIVAAHGSETFDRTTAPAATSTVGALFIWQSDGTNWVLVGKI